MTAARKLPGGRSLRIALGQRAYERRDVRLVERDLSGCAHLVATRHGLFAVNPNEHRLIAHGLFFGLTIGGNDIFAFEACDRPRAPSSRGRIVRLRRQGDRIMSAEVIAEGLDNGCHQIDLIGDTLFVADTYRQRIVAIEMGGGRREYEPLPGLLKRGAAAGYAHVNSLIASGEQRLILLHNGAEASHSEVALLDADWRLLERRPLAGQGCHSFAILENGSLLSCGSFAGELIGSDGLRAKVTELMTRGLSVGADTILVGGSTFSERDLRDDLAGAIYFLDRGYRTLATLQMPGPPMEIRRIDGEDLSLSNHVSKLGLAVRWPA